MVPNGWEVKSPSKLFKLFSGFAFKSSDAQESGAKWLKIANVGIGEIKWDADSFLPEHFLIEHKKYLLTKGDIVVALTRPTLGNKLKVARLNRDSDTSLLNQRVAKIVCEKNVDSEFTFQVLRSDLFAFRINVGLLGTDPPNLSVKVLEDFNIPVPPLPEQRKIAQILSTWDKAISTTERLIDNSKQQKKALMQQLLTGKKRLLDDTGKPFEGEWEEVKLSQLVKVIGGNAFKSEEFKSEGIPLVKISNIKPDYSICLDSTVFIAENEKFEKFKVIKGHVLIAMSGATTGKVGCYQSENFAYLNQRVGRFDIKHGRTINQYLFQLLKLPKVQHEILIDAVGGAQPNISNKDIERIKISVPAVEEQQKITSVLSNADKEIELLEQQLADLKQEKKALMQQLLTGKRRVKI